VRCVSTVRHGLSKPNEGIQRLYLRKQYALDVLRPRRYLRTTPMSDLQLSDACLVPKEPGDA
jgi:hypothetical protein